MVAEELASAPPERFAFARLQSGVQVRDGGWVKNIWIYAPNIVRVNANPGQSHTTQPSLVVVAQPTAVPLEIKEQDGRLTITSAALHVQVDKTTSALTFLRPDGTVITRESTERPAQIKQV